MTLKNYYCNATVADAAEWKFVAEYKGLVVAASDERDAQEAAEIAAHSRFRDTHPRGDLAPWRVRVDALVISEV